MDEIEDALYIFYFQADYYDCTNSTELGWYCEDLASTKEQVSGFSDPVKSKVSAYVDCMTKFWSGESCTCWIDSLDVVLSSLISEPDLGTLLQ